MGRRHVPALWLTCAIIVISSLALQLAEIASHIAAAVQEEYIARSACTLAQHQGPCCPVGSGTAACPCNGVHFCHAGLDSSTACWARHPLCAAHPVGPPPCLPPACCLLPACLPALCSMEFVAAQFPASDTLTKAYVNYRSTPYLPDIVAIVHQMICLDREERQAWAKAGSRADEGSSCDAAVASG